MVAIMATTPRVPLFTRRDSGWFRDNRSDQRAFPALRPPLVHFTIYFGLGDHDQRR